MAEDEIRTCKETENVDDSNHSSEESVKSGLHSPTARNNAALAPEAAAIERRVLRKIDTWIFLLLVITFMIQYTDKVILNSASQFGIIQDLHLYQVTGTNPVTNEPVLDLKRYSNATLIFYWGCLAGRRSTMQYMLLSLILDSTAGFVSGSEVAHWQVHGHSGDCVGCGCYAHRRDDQL